ncbi:3-isopropylmalate dehydratase small subunit [Streptomyces sp. NPDC046727]|uniref:3-isopropylmalate dehydratase small subunit n=1 Tax=Streptomyces sp. NPDC046727 TaxID=3155373 RepID=UPI0033EC4AF6
MREALVRHTGTVAPLERSSVDTDQIIPARFCKRLGRTGYEDTLFSRWRQDPDFPVTSARHAGASILVSGPDFGIGSSREHAVWALRDFGFRVVVASSFGDIFRQNATKNGLLTAEVPEEGAARLRRAAAARPDLPVLVDLERRAITADGLVVTFDIDEYSRWQLMNGLDDLQATLSKGEKIDAYEATRPGWLPTTIGT